MKERLWIAIDQYDNKEVFWAEYPRKELLKRMCRKKATPMYIDRPDMKEPKHVGWVIGGRWFSVFQLYNLHGGEVSK